MGHEVQHLKKKKVFQQFTKTEEKLFQTGKIPAVILPGRTLTSCRESFGVNSRGTFFPRVEIYHI